MQNSESDFQSDQATSAYVHVPFCAHRCGYCDFTLVSKRDHLIDHYLKGIESELQNVTDSPLLHTLYLGGGTPSHLSCEQLEHLFALLSRTFQFTANCEITIEVNPIDLHRKFVDLLASHNVNRVSLGVQSFHPKHLQLLERDHTPGQIVEGVQLLQKHIPNISLDLIFGIPHQTLDDWILSLEQCIALNPAHVSTYGLTYEKGTSFWSRKAKGTLIPVPEELEREMYLTGIDRLGRSGFHQYEISNFAQSGFQSRHNRAYWLGESYYGFGPGAARYLNGKRERNHRSVTTWLKRVLNGESGISESEELPPEDRARERMIFQLRMNEGIETKSFEIQTGFAPKELAQEAIEQHLKSGMLQQSETHLALTPEGRLLADSIAIDLL